MKKTVSRNISKEDKHQSVELLDKFTKTFCKVKNAEKLEFRCKHCPFEQKDGTCMLKEFKCMYEPQYKDFGSMGDL